MNKTTSGFTIVELLIVIVVVAILAVISVVMYSGIQDRANTSTISSSLNQTRKSLELYRVDRDGYPLTEDFSSIDTGGDDAVTLQYSSRGGGDYCLSGVINSLVYHTTSAAQIVKGGCPEQTWPGGTQVTNLVSNGDFSSGTSGWSCNAARCIVSSVDGYGQFVGSGGDYPNYEARYTFSSGNNTIGHLYYIRFDVRVVNGAPSGIMVYNGQSTYYDSSITQNVWSSRSSVHTVASAGSGGYVRISWPDAASQLGKITNIDNVVIINLTESFGVGNEPSVGQMDSVLQQFPDRHFSGTVTISLG